MQDPSNQYFEPTTVAPTGERSNHAPVTTLQAVPEKPEPFLVTRGAIDQQFKCALAAAEYAMIAVPTDFSDWAAQFRKPSPQA
jgi:hypothetical protein